MGRYVIVAYKPKPGREGDIKELVREHVPILRREGLATDAPVTTMQAADGTVIEVFEWTSMESLQTAHKNPEVLKLWTRFEEVCTYEPLANLDEAKQMFAGFAPLF